MHQCTMYSTTAKKGIDVVHVGSTDQKAVRDKKSTERRQREVIDIVRVLRRHTTNTGARFQDLLDAIDRLEGQR